MTQQGEPGDVVLIIDTDNYAVEYYTLVETDPHYIIRSEEYPEIFGQLRRFDRQFKLLGALYSHIVIISKPWMLRDEAKCSILYKDYKKTCNAIWNETIQANRPDEYYFNLIREFEQCRERRIIHIEKCGIQDSGHIGAVIKMTKLIKRAERQLEIEHARRFEEMELEIKETLRWWKRAEYGMITQQLFRVPRIVLLEYLLENVECVHPWMIQLFGDLYEYESRSLNLETCTLPRSHLIYLIEKILENEECLDLDDLFLVRSKAVQKAYQRLDISSRH